MRTMEREARQLDRNYDYFLYCGSAELKLFLVHWS